VRRPAGNGVGADSKQQRAEFVVKLTRQVAAFVVLQRDDPAHRLRLFMAQTMQRAGEFVGLFGTGADSGGLTGNQPS